MKKFADITAATALLVAGCAPSAQVVTDVGVIDSVPFAALANSSVQQEVTTSLLEGIRGMNASAGAVVIPDVYNTTRSSDFDNA